MGSREDIAAGQCGSEPSSRSQVKIEPVDPKIAYEFVRERLLPEETDWLTNTCLLRDAIHEGLGTGE